MSAAQAFHWFDPAAFRQECQRILKPRGKVLLVWNQRDVLLQGLVVTIEICAIAFSVAIVMGLVFILWGRELPARPASGNNK